MEMSYGWLIAPSGDLSVSHVIPVVNLIKGEHCTVAKLHRVYSGSLNITTSPEDFH